MKVLRFVLFLITTSGLLAQNLTHDKYWVQFRDKDHSPYTLSQPGEFLSPKALKRRELQNIDLTYADLPVSPFYIDSLKKLGFRIISKSRWFNAVVVGITDSGQLQILHGLSFVKQYQPVKIFTGKRTNDKFVEEITGALSLKPYKQPYGAAWHQIHMLRGDNLHRMGYRGEGITIAVLDAGFMNADNLPVFSHLFERGKILATRDFVDGDTEVYDHHSHGTMVLSIMAADLPGVMTGTAPDANYVLLRTEDGSSEYIIEEDFWVAGAEFADSIGADIINSSLGYTTFDDPAMNHSYEVMDGNTTRVTIAADMAAARGILVVNSAGNSGNNAWQYIGAPADGDSVLAVAAVDSNGNRVNFSSIGPASDGDIKPDVAAQGYLTVIAYPDGAIRRGNGTSFSAPLIAGLAACLWQANPGSSAYALFRAIRESGNNAYTPDHLTGYGIPNFQHAWLMLRNVPFPHFETEQPRLFPNPFDEQVVLLYYAFDDVIATVEGFDITGKRWFDGQFLLSGNTYNTVYLDLSRLQSGYYFLKINVDGKKFTRRILKMP